MRGIIILILFTLQLKGQVKLANLFPIIDMEDVEVEVQEILSQSITDYFVRKNIKIKPHTPRNQALDSYDQKKLVTDVISRLEGKIDPIILNRFKEKISIDYFKYELLTYFILEDNGLSIEENKYRNELLTTYEIDSIS